DAFLEVLELDGSGDLGEQREGVGVPLAELVADGNLCAFLYLELGSVDDGVTLFFATLVVDDGDRTVAVHRDQVAGLRADRDQVDEANGAGVLGLEMR